MSNQVPQTDQLHESHMIPNSAGWFVCACGEVWLPRLGACHPRVERAQVILFKESGKYYTEEFWGVPVGAIGPYDMKNSPDFRRIGNGAVLVSTQEPWGFPHLLPKEDGS